MKLLHVDAGARGKTRLVHDDEDRVDLIRRIVAVFGEQLLAYCIMDTHLHLVLETSEEVVTTGLTEAFRGYTRRFNAKHRAVGPLLRGAVDVRVKDSRVELARTIQYDHRNPLKCTPPLADSELEFEWSSARAFAGLARTSYPNVRRARALVAEHAKWALPAPATLAGLEPLGTPSASPALLLAAVSAVLGLLPAELAAERRSAPLTAGRAAFMALGRLEGYVDRQLAPWIGRSRQRANALVFDACDADVVRAARTLLRVDSLRSRLERCRGIKHPLLV